MQATVDMTPQKRRFLANDLAQAALEWFFEERPTLPYDDTDRMNLAYTLAITLERKGV